MTRFCSWAQSPGFSCPFKLCLLSSPESGLASQLHCTIDAGRTSVRPANCLSFSSLKTIYPSCPRPGENRISAVDSFYLQAWMRDSLKKTNSANWALSQARSTPRIANTSAEAERGGTGRYKQHTDIDAIDFGPVFPGSEKLDWTPKVCLVSFQISPGLPCMKAG